MDDGQDGEEEEHSSSESDSDEEAKKQENGEVHSKAEEQKAQETSD